MKKFRVWDKVNKKMYYDEFWISNDGILFKQNELMSISPKSYPQIGEVTTVDRVTKETIRSNKVRSEYLQNDDSFLNITNIYEQNTPTCDEERYIVMWQIERNDIAGQEVYQKDILRYETGYEFAIEFGKHDMYCPGDRFVTTNQGFIACRYEYGDVETKEIYPISEIEELAKVVGNTLEGYCKSDSTVK